VIAIAEAGVAVYGGLGSLTEISGRRTLRILLISL